MAVIKPSIKFEGSELNLNPSSTPYIQEGVRRAIFNKTTNQEGAYLYFLPSYKADRAGNGVWYKKITVRDNFGTSYKEKYVVLDKSQDPAEYFANNFRALFPEEARVGETEVNGKKFKKYPNYGRTTDRVVYNVAFAQNLGLGAHVLDLPLRNGADSLMNWLEGKDMMGRGRQPINDPDHCVPVFVKLKENSANPWMIQIENSEAVRLPEQLADSDYLYNLDEIFVIKSKEEIISKLRDMYDEDTFDQCMNGFPGLTRASSPKSRPAPSRVREPEYDSEDEDEVPMRNFKPAPAPISIPKANIQSAKPQTSQPVTAVPTAPVNAPAAIDLGSLPPNPMAGKLSRAEALKFINED